MAAGDSKKHVSNEKNVYAALLQKTYTIDFLEKKRVRNTEIVPQYYVKNSYVSTCGICLFPDVKTGLLRLNTLA